MGLHDLYVKMSSPWGEDVDIERLCDWAASEIERLNNELENIKEQKNATSDLHLPRTREYYL